MIPAGGEWAKSVIITIPKKGDLAEYSNYRIKILQSICEISQSAV